MVNMLLEKAVIVFSKSGCYMTHVVKQLLLGLGANPAVYVVDEVTILDELETIAEQDGEGVKIQFPAVFIAGRLFGGLDRVIEAHVSGELIPILKDAGALWL